MAGRATPMRDPTGAPISRRAFLGVSAALLSAAALEACSSGATTESKPAAPAATTAPAAKSTEAAKPAAPAAAAQPTTAPAAQPAASGGGKTVKAIVQASWGELGMRDATAAYNEAMKSKGITVELEDIADGFEPRVLAM